MSPSCVHTPLRGWLLWVTRRQVWFSVGAVSLPPSAGVLYSCTAHTLRLVYTDRISAATNSDGLLDPLQRCQNAKCKCLFVLHGSDLRGGFEPLS